MEGKSEEAVVREYEGLQMHLNARNNVFSKMREMSKDIFKWELYGWTEEEQVPQAV